MLSTPVHKDMSTYKAKPIGSLTIRKFCLVVAGMVVPALFAIYITFVIGADPRAYSQVYGFLGLPFWWLAFAKPKGLEPEEYFIIWANYKLDKHKKLKYIPTSKKLGLSKKVKGAKVSNKQREFALINGIEAYRPGESGWIDHASS